MVITQLLVEVYSTVVKTRSRATVCYAWSWVRVGILLYFTIAARTSSRRLGDGVGERELGGETLAVVGQGPERQPAPRVGVAELEGAQPTGGGERAACGEGEERELRGRLRERAGVGGGARARRAAGRLPAESASRGRARARGALRRHEKLLLRQVNFFFIKLFKN